MSCWTKYFIAAAASVLGSLAFGPLAIACDAHGPLKSARSQTVSLRGISDAFGFYLRGQQDELMLFEAQDVVNALQDRMVKLRAEGLNPAAKNSEALLASVRRDLPLRESTDLFKYALTGDYGREVEAVAAQLLRGGRAYVNSWSSFQKGLPTLAQIKVLSRTTKNGTVIAQAFCTLDNSDLLTIINIVE